MNTQHESPKLPSEGCKDFQQHVISHYTGANTLHEDAKKAHQLYQSSIMSALMEGVYEGEMTFGELALHGDFGLGTFNDLDGEMIGLDGKFFQLRADGSANAVHSDQKTPFATVNFFSPDKQIDVDHSLDKKGLQQLIDKAVGTNNLFFAIRVDGLFEKVNTRTVSVQQRPFRPLTDVTEGQATFDFQKETGTLIGYRSPNYAQGLTVAGYHLHFITGNRQGGGHVLDFQLAEGTVRIDSYSDLFVSLPQTPDFEKARLSLNDDAIKKAEGS